MCICYGLDLLRWKEDSDRKRGRERQAQTVRQGKISEREKPKEKREM